MSQFLVAWMQARMPFASSLFDEGPAGGAVGPFYATPTVVGLRQGLGEDPEPTTDREGDAMSDPTVQPGPGLQNPIEDEIEAGYSALKSANSAYKRTIGDTKAAASETASAKRAHDDAAAAEQAAQLSEGEAKTELVNAIDGQMASLRRARGMLVPPTE